MSRVSPGDPLVIRASDWNSAMDAAQAFRNKQTGVDTGTSRPSRNYDTVLIRNDHTADIPQFGVLGIDSILFTPTENLQGFKNGVAFKGVAPTTADHLGKFVIALEPIGVGKLGLACLSGLVQVKVAVGNEAAATFADVEKDHVDRLTADAGGAAEILYREEGIGDKWAVVRMASASAHARAKIVTVQPNHLTCQLVNWNGIEKFPINVAKPIHIRASTAPESRNVHGQIVNVAFTNYSADGQVRSATATISGTPITNTEYVNPRYVAGEFIFVSRNICGATGVTGAQEWSVAFDQPRGWHSWD